MTFSKAKREIKTEIKGDVLAVALKILVGIILATIIVISIASLGETLLNYLLAQENGISLSVLLLSAVAATSGFFLVMILRPKPTAEEPPKDSLAIEDLVASVVSVVLVAFARGLSDGYKKRPARRR